MKEKKTRWMKWRKKMKKKISGVEEQRINARKYVKKDKITEQ